MICTLLESRKRVWKLISLSFGHRNDFFDGVVGLPAHSLLLQLVNSRKYVQVCWNLYPSNVLCSMFGEKLYHSAEEWFMALNLVIVIQATPGFLYSVLNLRLVAFHLSFCFVFWEIHSCILPVSRSTFC